MTTSAVAFFDMDRTLLRVNSGRLWLGYLREHGEISLPHLLRAIGWLTQYKLAILDIDTVGAKVVAGMAGDSEDELADKARVFFKERIESQIAEEGRRAILHHRSRGDEVALLTSSTRYFAEPLAEILGIEHVLCTTLGVKGGVFDGTIVAPPCYGAGKVEHAARFCEERGLDLEHSFFYTDSFADLPMLERVRGARVVNPDARLARFAAKVGWEVLSW